MIINLVVGKTPGVQLYGVNVRVVLVGEAPRIVTLIFAEQTRRLVAHGARRSLTLKLHIFTAARWLRELG